MTFRPSAPITTAVAACLLAAAAACPAQSAASSPRYVGLHLGAHALEDWRASVDFGGVRSDGAAVLKSAWHGGVQLGHRSANARWELEWQHGALPVRGIALGPLQQSADRRGHYDALTVNALRTFTLGGDWRAFAGGGLGWGRAELPAVAFANGCQCFGAARRSGATWQARVGAEYQADARWQAQLSLSWLRLQGPRADSRPAVTYVRRDVPTLNAGVLLPF